MRNTILFTLVMVLLSTQAYAKPIIYRVLPEDGAFTMADNNCGEDISVNHAMYISKETVIKIDDVTEFMSLEFKLPNINKDDKTKKKTERDERIASMVVFGGSSDPYATARPPKTPVAKRPARGFWRSDKVDWTIAVVVHQEVSGKTPIEIHYLRPTSATNNAQKCLDTWKGFAQKEREQ